LTLLFVPSLVGQLVLGEQLTGVAIPVARVRGIALIALAISCWPGHPLVGILTYSASVAVYLACLGFVGGLTGVFLWPVVIRDPDHAACARAVEDRPQKKTAKDK
jgi:hypothetical protein